MNKDEAIIEAENILREGGASSESIDEILRLFSEKDASLQNIDHDDGTDDEIRMRILDEKDWRKRASLSAMLISRSLTN